MKLLVVDDDVIEVEQLIKGMPWKDWGITGVDFAYNIKDAKDKILCDDIDILLCDIEMPMGSGIELIEWLRQSERSDIVTIILTCHTDFEYALQAIKLGCQNYLLKPVEEHELMESILKAVLSIHQKEREQQFGEEQYFWADILARNISSDQEIGKLAELHNRKKPERKCAPVYLSVKYIDSAEQISPILIGFIVDNIVSEIMKDTNLIIALQQDCHMEMILADCAESDMERTVALFDKVLSVLTERCRIYADIYIGRSTEPSETAAEMTRLMQIDQKCVVTGKVIRADRTGAIPAKAAEMFTEQEIAQLIPRVFADNRFMDFYHSLEQKLSKCDEGQISLGSLTHDNIRLLRHIRRSETARGELAGILDSVEKERGAEVGSVPEMLDFYRNLFERYDEAYRKKNWQTERSDIIENVKTYISMNIDRDLSRDDLAKYVSMNGDYLNRIFKEATGKSIIHYINDEKMDMSKRLLGETTMTVSEIAEMVGFTNYSYFTTFFKKNAGMTPAAYREKHGKE